MGPSVPVLDRSRRLTCVACGQAFVSGVVRFEEGRKSGHLCPACAANTGSQIDLRGHGRPVLLLCAAALAAAVAVLALGALMWAALRIALLPFMHVSFILVAHGAARRHLHDSSDASEEAPDGYLCCKQQEPARARPLGAEGVRSGALISRQAQPQASYCGFSGGRFWLAALPPSKPVGREGLNSPGLSGG